MICVRTVGARRRPGDGSRGGARARRAARAALSATRARRRPRRRPRPRARDRSPEDARGRWVFGCPSARRGWVADSLRSSPRGRASPPRAGVRTTGTASGTQTGACDAGSRALRRPAPRARTDAARRSPSPPPTPHHFFCRDNGNRLFDSQNNNAGAWVAPRARARRGRARADEARRDGLACVGGTRERALESGGPVARANPLDLCAHASGVPVAQAATRARALWAGPRWRRRSSTTTWAPRSRSSGRRSTAAGRTRT